MKKRIWWLVTCGLLALGVQAGAQDLGDGRGIDHVAALVRPESFKIHYLGARGAEVRYNNNTLALLEPDGPGLVADFVAERGQGIMGVSVQVADLDAARALVNGNTGLDLESFKYKGRERFLIPDAVTHGFMVEMVE